MRRVISGLIVGIAAFAVSAQPTPPQPEAPTPTVAERAQLYQRIASLDSTAELAKLARETAAASAVNQREQLTLILERHFELDPAGTVGLAGELFHGRHVTGRLRGSLRSRRRSGSRSMRTVRRPACCSIVFHCRILTRGGQVVLFRA